MMQGMDAPFSADFVAFQRTLPLCTVTAIVFFGSIVFTTVSMATKSWLHGDIRGKQRRFTLIYNFVNAGGKYLMIHFSI